MFRMLSHLLHPKLEWIQLDMGSESLKEGRFSLRRAHRKVWIDRHMPLEVFEQALPGLMRVRMLHLQGWGEPLLNPEFFSLAQMAKTTGAALTTSFSDPDLMDRKTLDLLVDMGFVSITMGLGSINEERNLDRNGVSVHASFRALERLAATKQRLGAPFPKVVVLYTLHRSSLDELAHLPGLLQNLDVQVLLVKPLTEVPEPELVQDTVVPGSEEEYWELEEQFRQTAQEAGNRSMEMHSFLLHADKAPLQCIVNVNRGLYLGAMGDVSPCIFSQFPAREAASFHFQNTVQEFRRIVFGNVMEQPLKAIWGSRGYQEFRAQAGQHGGAELCGGCWRRFLVTM